MPTLYNRSFWPIGEGWTIGPGDACVRRALLMQRHTTIVILKADTITARPAAKTIIAVGISIADTQQSTTVAGRLFTWVA
jgi:hypothetical protein